MPNAPFVLRDPEPVRGWRLQRAPIRSGRPTTALVSPWRAHSARCRSYGPRAAKQPDRNEGQQ